MTNQCLQIVRAGHRCPRTAKRDGFCDGHWRKRFGHKWNIATMTCARCKGVYRECGETCLISPYLDQPPSVYPEPYKAMKKYGEVVMIQNWPIHPVKAHHFRGPVSESGNEYRAMPELLRAIADWLEARDVKDGEFFDLTFAKSFTTHDEDDDVQQVATVYYVEEGG